MTARARRSSRGPSAGSTRTRNGPLVPAEAAGLVQALSRDRGHPGAGADHVRAERGRQRLEVVLDDLGPRSGECRRRAGSSRWG